MGVHRVRQGLLMARVWSSRSPLVKFDWSWTITRMCSANLRRRLPQLDQADESLIEDFITAAVAGPRPSFGWAISAGLRGSTPAGRDHGSQLERVRVAPA